MSIYIVKTPADASATTYIHIVICFFYDKKVKYSGC